jgi:hypothetical protein
MQRFKIVAVLALTSTLFACAGEESGSDSTITVTSTDEAPADEVGTVEGALTAAPSCVVETGSSVNGFTNTAYWTIKNNCTYTVWVRLDIADHADTGCKYIGANNSATFSMSFGGGVWDPMKDYRSIADCNADR